MSILCVIQVRNYLEKYLLFLLILLPLMVVEDGLAQDRGLPKYHCN